MSAAKASLARKRQQQDFYEDNSFSNDHQDISSAAQSLVGQNNLLFVYYYSI